MNQRLLPFLLAALFLSACREPVVEADPIRPAQVWTVKQQLTETVDSYSGEIHPRQTVDFSFRVPGKLVSRQVAVGDSVTSGQVLAEFDREDANLTVSRTESGLQSSLGTLASVQSNLNAAQGTLVSARANQVAAQAGLESAQSAVDTARSSANAAQATVGAAQAEVRNAQLEYQRSAKLKQQGYASQAVMDRDTQRLQTAQASLKSAQANAAAAQSQVQAAIARVKTARAQVQAASGEIESATANMAALQGQIKTAQAQVDSNQDQLKLVKNQSGYSQLSSTVEGVVTRSYAEAGQVIAAGQPVVSIARAGEFDVQIRVGEQAINQLHTGMEASISLWADQSQSLTGSIREIAPAADENRTWLIKVSINPGNDLPSSLRLGMTARVSFHKTLAEQLVWLPATALYQQEQQPAVWVVNAENQVGLQVIRVAQYQDSGMLVTGLKVGQQVVAAGVNRLFAGQAIKPIPYDGTASPVGVQ